ncbi:hypothetical protein Lsai_2905 [Legionella sainthelensi]|uniref:Uncharacterized protein n=1 Tax=Legionella sainthelensi TaxID=28087 RepID=A0A0W0YC27_9GAMM|nr:hypothetical protein [Legionella sainthelensi]KTD54083.1 hypothetical protein Lsai_2905 [Legionella sainthelensi]
MRARILNEAIVVTRRMTSMSRMGSMTFPHGTFPSPYINSNVMPYTPTHAFSTSIHSNIRNIIKEYISDDGELSEGEKSQLVNSASLEVMEFIANAPQNFKINRNLQEYYDNIDGHASNDPKTKTQEVKVNSTGDKPQGTNDAKENIKDETAQKARDSSAKNIMSSKELQEKVFREAKEHVQDNRGLLFSFNLVENTLKKVSAPLFDGLYTVFADKDGIPEHKSEAVLRLAKWIVLAILIYSLHQYYNKKYEEIEKMDKNVIARYAEVEELYDKAVLIAQECVRQLNSIQELERDIDLNLELLNLLENCANSENDPDGYIAKFKVFLKAHIQARLDSVLNDKSFKASKLDHKIQRELKYQEEHNPLASKLLEAKGAKGFQGTKNALEDKIIELDREIKHKKEGIQIKNKQINLKKDQIKEISEKTEKDEAKIMRNPLVRLGIFTPQFTVNKHNCLSCKEELINTQKEEDIDDTLRMSVD